MDAETILINGRVYSMDHRIPHATAVALGNGRILDVGEDEVVLAYRGDKTEVIDLQGKSVLPGFTDGHMHLVEWALQRKQVNLWGVSSLAEALERVKAFSLALSPGEWLRGGGWDASLWKDLDGEWPRAAHLDAVVPDRPVALDSKDLHTLWVNSYTLRLAGIDENTPDPPGGAILRDPSTGKPTGILKERARELVFRLYPEETEDTWVAALQEAQRALWAEGIVAVHVLNDREDMRNFRALQRMREEGSLRLRTLLYFPASRQEEAIRLGLRSGFGDRYVRIGGIKYFVDGTLGSRTAALLIPYEGEPENRGILVTEPDALYEGVHAASQAGLAVAIHAIGDRGNREALNVLDVVRAEERDNHRHPGIPHRIEHAQLLYPEDIKRLAQLDVIASMQPIHATQDMPLAQKYWGDRCRYAYAWRSIAREGALLLFGSDAPVEQPSVFAGLHAAVTRRRADGTPEGGWIPEERLCLRPALHAYTLAPALVERSDAWRGTLYPGKVADLIVLDGDPFWRAYHDPDRLLDLRVEMTFFEGEIVYRR